MINTPGHDNVTPLHDAVANGRLKVVKLLVDRGAVLTLRFFLKKYVCGVKIKFFNNLPLFRFLEIDRDYYPLTMQRPKK